MKANPIPILEIENLTLSFGKKSETVTVLRNINLTVFESESVAIVGESGCGKTTLGKTIVDIHQPTAGTIKYYGQDIRKMDKKAYRNYRLSVQMVQQDSFAALNPYKTICHSVSSPLLEHKFVANEQEARVEVARLLTDVGLVPVEHYIDKYPHQLSGGQRQRVLIARALGVKPKLIVADEPVSMVDVSLRISLLQLMRDMNQKYGVSFVYITHDLATARYISDYGQLVVMYLGEIIEKAQIKEATKDPLHPYFKALIQAVPQGINGQFKQVELPLKGIDIPDIKKLPTGCPFHPRCIYATAACSQEQQLLTAVGNREVACMRVHDIKEMVGN